MLVNGANVKTLDFGVIATRTADIELSRFTTQRQAAPAVMSFPLCRNP